MRILALETSTDFGTCCLWQDGEIRSAACPAGRPHSETLLPLIGQLLVEAGISYADLDAVAFGQGPGAFTGLRVACGLAQGIAVGAGCPVLPVGSLEAMAWQTGAERVLSVLDARMGEVYFAAYQRRPEGLEQLREPGVAVPGLVPEPGAGDWLVAGNGLAAYGELAQRFQGWACRPDVLPHAEGVAALAALAWQRGEALDPALAIPRYVRDKVARTTAERLADGGRT